MTRGRPDVVAGDGTQPAPSRRARWPMWALTAFVALALIVLALLVWLFLSRSGDVGTDPSPSGTLAGIASPSASATASDVAEAPSASVAPSAPAPSAPAESAPPTDVPDIVVAPATWFPIAVFGPDDDGQTFTALYDLVAWDGGLLAVGRQFDGPPIEGQTPSRPVVWLSPTGETWGEVEPEFGAADVRVAGIVTLPGPEERLLAIGTIGFHQMPPPGEEAQRTAAWVSFDGVGWEEVSVPWGGGQAGNPALLAGSPDQTYVLAIGSEIWHSDDGREWISVHRGGPDDVVYTLASGEDGFVGVIRDADTIRVIASADAHEWVEAESPGAILSIAPLGPDWLATAATGEDGAFEIWRSTNGLEWERVMGVNDLTGPDGPKSGLGLASTITAAQLMSAGDGVYLALTWNHCCVLFESGMGTYLSTDGESWSELGLGDAAIREAADGPDGVVLGGILERGDQIGFWLEGR